MNKLKIKTPITNASEGYLLNLPNKSDGEQYTIAVNEDVVHNTGHEGIDGKKAFSNAAEFDAGIAFGASIDGAGAYIKNHTNNSYYDLEIGTGYKSSQIMLRDADAQYGIDGTGIRFKTSG